MLKKCLDEVSAILAQMMELTEEDIKDIQVAKHNKVTPSVEAKNELITKFVAAKKEFDAALVALNNSSTKGPSEMLDDEDRQKLNLLKQNLQTLRTKNKEYVKYVSIVENFLDGLVDTTLDINGGTDSAYGDKEHIPEIFRMRA